MKITAILDTMLANGLRPSYIAELTGVPEAEVLKRPGADGSASDDLISAAMKSLIWQAYEEASTMLRYGTDAAKTRIIMGLLGPAAKEVGKQAEQEMAEQLAQFRILMGADSHGDADEGDDPNEFDPSVEPAGEST